MSSWKAWLEGRGAGPPQGRERREETNADAAPPLDNVHPWGVQSIILQDPATTGAFTLRGIPEKRNLRIISYTERRQLAAIKLPHAAVPVPLHARRCRHGWQPSTGASWVAQ